MRYHLLISSSRFIVFRFSKKTSALVGWLSSYLCVTQCSLSIGRLLQRWARDLELGKRINIDTKKWLKINKHTKWLVLKNQVVRWRKGQMRIPRRWGGKSCWNSWMMTITMTWRNEDAANDDDEVHMGTEIMMTKYKWWQRLCITTARSSHAISSCPVCAFTSLWENYMTMKEKQWVKITPIACK